MSGREIEPTPEKKPLKSLSDILSGYQDVGLTMNLPKPEPDPTHWYEIVFADSDRPNERLEANSLTMQSVPGNSLPMIAFGIEDTDHPNWRPGTYRIKRLVNPIHVIEVNEIEMGIADDDIPRPEVTS